MNLVRVTLHVNNMSALAGVFTNGPALTAFHGLTAQLALDSGLEVKSFALCLEAYSPRMHEYYKLPDQRSGGGPAKQTAFRCADAVMALYLLVTSDVDEASLRRLAHAVNRARVQGGMITNFVTATDGVTAFTVDTCKELALKFFEYEKRLSYFYADVPAQPGLPEEQLLAHYATELYDAQRVVVRNGIVQVGHQDGMRIGEPNFGLADLTPVYTLKDLSWEDAESLIPRLFWCFDHKLHAAHPEFFVLNANCATEDQFL